jgi:sugar lactone lactonase YvrE
MNISKTTIRIALVGLVLATAASVAAVTTQSFVLDSADAFFEGEFEGAAVRSDGSVRVGAATKRIELEHVPLAYSMAQRGSTTFIGTGTNGVVYRFDGKNVKVFANTGELLVSSLAFGRDGALYAGTLPNGRIYRIDPKSGTMKRFSIPEGAKHIWALHYDKKRGQLIAGTGPEGKVFAIDSVGRARKLHDAEASHIMTLTGDDKGTIYAGTSDDAVVLRIRPNNTVEVVHDFPGNEVTAIDYHDGKLAVAANKFKTAPGSQFKPSPARAAPPGRPATRPRPGSGELWRVDAEGRAEMLVSRKDTHFTTVQWGTDGAIYAGGGHEGRILRVEPARRSTRASHRSGAGSRGEVAGASFSKHAPAIRRNQAKRGARGRRISSSLGLSRAHQDGSFRCAPSSRMMPLPCFAPSSCSICRRISAHVSRTCKAAGLRSSAGQRLSVALPHRLSGRRTTGMA